MKPRRGMAASAALAARLALLVVLAAVPLRASAMQQLEQREVERLLIEGDRALESARNQLQKGRDKAARSRLEEAEQAYGTILAADPGQRSAAVGMGAVYFLSKQYARAIDLLEPLAERWPDDVDLAYQLGMNLYREGRQEQALPLLTRAAAEDRHYDAMWVLALHYYRRAEWEAGLPFVQHYTEVRPEDDRALGLLGTYLLKVERFDDAVRALDRFVESHPDNVAALINRANALFRAGRVDEAASAYEGLLERYPDRLRLAYNLAAIRMRQGQCAEALPLLDRFIERQPDHATAVYFRADCHLRVGDVKHARSGFERVLRLSPNNPWAYHGLSRIAERTGQRAEALEDAGKALELGPDQWEIVAWYGTLLRRDGKASEALAKHDHAAELAPGEATVHVERGRDLWVLERLEDAEEAFTTAIARDAEREDARLGLATVLTAQGVKSRAAGDLGEARQHLRHALAVWAGYEAAVVNLGLLEIEARDLEAATATLNSVRESTTPDIDAVRAVAALLTGKKGEAHDAAERAIAGKASLTPLALQVRGQLAAAQGDWRAAADAFEAAFEEMPSPALRTARAAAWLEVGLDQLARGNPGSAGSALRSAARDRDNLNAHDRLHLDFAAAAAGLAASPGKRSVREMEALLRSGPFAARSLAPLRDLGAIYLAWAELRQERGEAALRALGRVKDREPYAAAIAKIETAAWDAEARRLYAAGAPKKAANVWSKLRKGATDPVIQHNLAAARFASGEVEAATEVWEGQLSGGGPAQATFNLAVARDRSGAPEQAWELFRAYAASGGPGAERARERAAAKAAVFGFEGGAP
ncbi:MAG: tetratricopeptide repeat protein [Deltaproteobacteria bacterium]|nr:tetratricopeptide repeat protein [Deltaproteobacteria bacterium]MCB9788094.1 tetratricopeptide repeat protein [Deltaproteobacteria bacterium]